MKTEQEHNPELLRTCPNCGVDNWLVPPMKYSWSTWLLKQCIKCGLVYLENPPTYESLATDFPWENDRAERNARMMFNYPHAFALSARWRKIRRALFKRKRNKLMDRVDRWFPDGRVADIGCGDGTNVLNLPSRFQPIGIDISQTYARICRERLAHRNITIVNAPAIEGMHQIPDHSLSGVIMRSFLEHELQPQELLNLTAEKLTAQGAVIIKVPNYACINRFVMGPRWCGFHFPGHVNYFSPRILREMVERAGLRVVQFNWLDHFWFSDNMWLVARR